MSNKKRILIVGFGFMGTNFYELFKDKYDIAVFDSLDYPCTLTNGLYGGEVVLYQGDICNGKALADAISNLQPDYIINFAAKSHVDRSINESESFVYTNVLGVENILKQINGTKIRLVQLSTDEVYGDTDVNSVEESKETDRLKPSSPYSACFDYLTEVLTEYGWKKYTEINKNIAIGTLNLSTMKLEFHKPNDVYIYDFNGDMIHQANRRVDMLVTPNHRILYGWQRNNDGIIRPRFGNADSVVDRPITIQTSAPWEQEQSVNKDYFELPGCAVMNNTKLPKIIDMDSWLKFLGWYLSEGSTSISKTGSYTIKLSTAYRHKEALEIVKNIGFIGKNYGGNGIYVLSKQLGKYLKQFGGSYNKFIPNSVKKLPNHKLTILLENLINGDGHRSGDGRRYTYTTVSRKLADDVQEISLKLGYSANISRYKHFYRVNIIKLSRTTQINQIKNKNSYIKYTGKIWCINVPNETVLVRRNGKAFFSGNSKAAADMLVNAYHRTYGVDVVTVRPTNNYGPYQYPEKLIPFILKRISEDKTVPIYGDGSNTREWLYVEDCCRAIELVMRNGISGEIYNIGSGNDNRVSNVYIATNIDYPKIPKTEYIEDRKGHDRRYAVDSTKIRDLGWSHKVEIKEGLKKTKNWYLKRLDVIKQLMANPHIK